MVLSTYKQASTLLIHQQGFIAAGPFQSEGPETMPGLEFCRGTSLRTYLPCQKPPKALPGCLSIEQGCTCDHMHVSLHA
jgi:hypothetical protein